jgi:hypothetical protein
LAFNGGFAKLGNSSTVEYRVSGQPIDFIDGGLQLDEQLIPTNPTVSGAFVKLFPPLNYPAPHCLLDITSFWDRGNRVNSSDLLSALAFCL